MDNYIKDEKITKKEINKTKKFISRKILRICIVIIIVLVLYVIYWSSIEKIAFLEDHSPNKINQVEIFEIGHGMWNGSNLVKIYIKNYRGTIVAKEYISVSNFFRDHSKDQYKIDWENDFQVKITIRYEVNTKTLEYNFETREIKKSIKPESNKMPYK